MRQKKYFQISIHVGVLVGLLGSCAVFAADNEGKLNTSVSTAGSIPSTSGKKAEKNWRDETEASCGMACRYHRANDNLTLQALYLVTKLQKIGDAIQKNEDSSARTALGAFCKSDTEALAVCYGRYQAFQRVGLLEIRQAIGKNEDTIATLTTGRRADGTVVGTALAFEVGGEKAPYLPEVPTLAELEQAYLDGKLKPKGTAYSRSEIMKWSQSLIINNPNTRYLEFNKTPVVGNPYQDEKSNYSLNTEKRGYGDRTGPDARAVKLYKESEDKIKEFAEDQGKEISGTAKAVGVSKDLKKDDTLSHDSFVKARSIVNSKIETDVKNSDADKPNGDIERKLASDEKAVPSVYPSGVPSPAVGATPSADVSRDLKVKTGTNATRSPTGMKTYGENEKVERPAEMKNSRYIKYDVSDILDDIENTTH